MVLKGLSVVGVVIVMSLCRPHPLVLQLPCMNLVLTFECCLVALVCIHCIYFSSVWPFVVYFRSKVQPTPLA